MLKIIFRILFLFFTIFPFTLKCQITDTSNYRNINFGIIIGPTYEFSRINYSQAYFGGIKISLTTRHDEIGISLQKLNPKVISIIYSNTDLKFNILSGELFYNKYFKICDDLSLSLGSSLGCAFIQLKFMGDYSLFAMHYYKDGVFTSDTYLFLKPQVGLEYNIWKNFLISINTGYRITGGLNVDFGPNREVMNFTNKDFNNFFIDFSIKYIFVIK